MTKRLIARAALATALVSGGELRGQSDGLVAYPETYKVQFENEWVRLVRVRLAAGANLGMHSHPAGFMFHVYLNDADPIWFNHDGAPGEIMRPAVTARSYRIGRATPESHAVVNPSAHATDFLRVEYKTRGSETGHRRVIAEHLPTTTTAVVEHTREQSRVTRVTVAPGGSYEVVAPAGQPALLVLVTDGTIGGSPASRPDVLVAGAERFVTAGAQATIHNAGTTPLQFLRFDFLTPPAVIGG